MEVSYEIPEPGLYYHYKHDPHGMINNYAYEFIGVGCHTEDDCNPEDKFLAVYRPLYMSSVYNAGKLFDVRPLRMWGERVVVNGDSVPRFSRITDQNIIQTLMRIREILYP